MWWTRGSDVAVITDVPPSPDYEFRRRRHRYTVMMSFRVVCVLGAVFTYTFSMWLAVAFVVVGTILPWWAVVLANAGPPRKRRRASPPISSQRGRSLPEAGHGAS